MSGALDMTLDDLIKNSKKSGGGRGGGGGRGRGRGRGAAGPGPSRRFPNNRGVNRSVPYAAATAAAKAPESTWQHDLFPGQAGAYPPNAAQTFSIETGTKLYVSNLDYGVSIEDIKELFSEVGDLKRYTIHYDRSGRSKGTAEVVFTRRLDAVEAVKRYNNVQLDGKPMKIEIVGTNIGAPPPVPVPTIMKGTFGNPNGFSRSGQGRGAAPRLSRGGHANGGRGRGGKVSAEDLDADLDKYHAEAMQIN